MFEKGFFVCESVKVGFVPMNLSLEQVEKHRFLREGVGFSRCYDSKAWERVQE